MAINFKEVPTENPFGLLPEGLLLGKVIKAEVKTPKPTATNPKPKPYLNVTSSMSNGKGQKLGNFFDMFSESTHQVALYKIGRFTKALGLNLTGSVELKDLAKIIVGKEFVVDIEHQDDSRFPKDSGHKQAKAKIFGSECYWPASEFATLLKERYGELGQPEAQEPNEGNEEDVPFEFTAEDGEPETTAEMDEDL